MATVNIKRDNKDPFYRYKMPKIISKVEGKGNGIKTVIVNMVEVAKALNRQPVYPTKFFGGELGAQTVIDEKNARYIVNGAHDADKLQSLLDVFITKFVLCGSCENPETDLMISKDGMISKQCKACGAKSSVDMNNRLSSYIVKNPPPKPSKKEMKGRSHTDSNAMSQEALAAGSSAGSNEKMSSLQAEIDSPAVLADMITGTSSMSLTADDPEDLAEEEGAVDEFGDFVMANRTAPNEEIVNKMNDLDIDNAEIACSVLIQTLFTEDILNEIPKRKGLFADLVVDNSRAQRAILGGVERLVTINFPDLEKKLPSVLLALYNNDYIEEDAVFKWHQKASRKYVDKETAKRLRKVAEPFVKWLQEAESEEESDNEE